MVEPDDGIKLLLEAFQMSVSACLAHPSVAMLHAQLTGRLMLVRKTIQVTSNAHAPTSHEYLRPPTRLTLSNPIEPLNLCCCRGRVLVSNCRVDVSTKASDQCGLCRWTQRN